MEVSSRRKACDLCFKKKIRCDSLKPSCSNCVLYKTSCKTTTVRRRPPISQPAAPSDPTAKPKDAQKEDDLTARLARIEAKLDGLRNSSGGYMLGDIIQGAFRGDHQPEASPEPESSPAPLSMGDWMGPRSTRGIPVPPMNEALMVVEVFFKEHNSVVPLFDQHSFMTMFQEYYTRPSERRRICGAVINVVLALGYRIRSIMRHGDDARGFDETKIKTCVDNAQMMLDELMTRDEDLLGLQALLGLVFLFVSNPDQAAAAVLNSAAVRLAYSMQLESKTMLSKFSMHEARQRCNIAWVCYMLDKDVSLRNIAPSSTRNEDFDIDLPSIIPSPDNFSLLSSQDGLSQFNLFRAKVQLAHIEGKIYDCLLSNRASKLSNEARQQVVIHLDRLLERWKQSIPPSFHLDNMGKSLVAGPFIHMTLLYQTYQMCLTTLHGLYSLDSAWLNSLGGLGTDLLRTIAPRGAICMEANHSKSPAVWEKCVGTSLGLLRLLVTGSHSGCSVWLSCCAYFSSLTFVFVDLISNPRQNTADEYRGLTKMAMLRMENILSFRGLEKFNQLRHILEQLQEAVESTLAEAKNTPPPEHTQHKYPWELGPRPLLLPSGNVFNTSFDGLPVSCLNLCELAF
ncbi:hypothetical protein F5Y16DRAFT_359174 [Xylariaceae sp. FL0255]|nr:hypothetical protein F5Y16DRAFT_359174 [Xylariaceae sp. FL0255]